MTAADVLDPGSDLRQVVAAAEEIDVLVARVDSPEPARTPSPADALDYPDEPDGYAVADELLAGFTVPLPADEVPAVPLLPAGLHLHRLDLRWPVQEADEPDLVAALSELIGFDPEDQVFCVAPGPEGARDAEQAAVDRAVRRVARVYGLPVLHYRRVAGGAGEGGTEADVAVAPAV
ncbi:hypothetical protein [Pseudonocardia endophytica]|uniref:hypothetical protein n=1 Tax=Pseudonocardia endophytica TaxID=401976 RepID=UPI00104C9536|nr:hypothetical protein [Pseudonocardia endophytica]